MNTKIGFFDTLVKNWLGTASNCDGGTVLSYHSYSYDAFGNPTTVSEGPSPATLVTTHYTYDTVGNVLTQTVFGRTTTQVYDSDIRSQVIRTVSPMGLISSKDYDLSLGLLLEEKDSDGRVIEYKYDELGRKIKTTLKPPGFLSGSYVLETNEYLFNSSDASSTVITTKAKAGTGTISQFTMTDEWGRTMQSKRSSAGGWITADQQYDAFDRVIKQSLPYFEGQAAQAYTETSYDSLGRIARISRPGPNGTIVQNFEPGVVSMTSFTSDDGVLLIGLAQKEDRQNGQIVYQYKTADGRALATLHTTTYSSFSQPNTQISGWNRTRYHYDNRRQLRQVTRGVGTNRTPAEDADLTSWVVYDEWGRRSQVYDPDKGTSQYTHTEEGQPLCDTDPDGLTICRSYDTYGRLLTVIRQSNNKVLSKYVYDETESTLGTGRLTSVIDEAGTRRMHYDALTGKPARIERTYQALGNEKQFDIENTYDETGALVKRTFPSVNLSLRYEYHDSGPLSTMQLEDPDHRIIHSGTVMNVVQTSPPDALGNIGTITYGNGVTIQSRYSPAGMLEKVTTQGNEPLSDYEYHWNDEGMLVTKNDMLVADGINRSEQFSYDRSRRLIQATGPYGDRNTPHRTIDYSYGADGQPIVADEKLYSYDTSNTHRLRSYNHRTYTYDNDTTPTKNKGLVVERRAPGNVISRFQYHWTGRIKQAQTVNASTITTVDYEYDTEGNRFIKRTDLGGIVSEIHDLSSDYRVHADGTSEVHTIEVRNGNEPIAKFRFQDNHHNGGVWAPGNLFSHRLGADLLRIASLEGGITKLPSLMAYAAADAYYAVKLLPQIQNRTRFLVMLYWTFASLIALAAITLLIRNWRRNKDTGPGLLPVSVYRFGSIVALLSFSATGCIKTPQTQNGSEYLLAATGLLNQSSEGGVSNIMSVLGAFYYISTHNGSTDIVTNSNGIAVARFVYEPFGKVNSELTDLDPDRNGVHYGESFLFTGQEFEPETGMYNYKARIYDAETGRFLQPDPVHTDQPGQDNWDRYQYVWNNPVNFVDPDGEAPCVHIYGRYTGPGACRQTPAGRDQVLGALLLFFSAQTPKERAFFLQIWIFLEYFKSPPGKTMVDEGSRIHDRDGSRYTSYRSKNANSEWIRNATSMWTGGGLLGPIPTKRGWDKTFSREKKGLGSRYSGDINWGTSEFSIGGSNVSIRWKMHFDFTPVVATINTMFTLIAEWGITALGTILFGATNLINEAGHWMHKQTFVRENRLFMRKARFDRLSIPSARYKNLINPKKWRL